MECELIMKSGNIHIVNFDTCTNLEEVRKWLNGINPNQSDVNSTITSRCMFVNIGEQAIINIFEVEEVRRSTG